MLLFRILSQLNSLDYLFIFFHIFNTISGTEWPNICADVSLKTTHSPLLTAAALVHEIGCQLTCNSHVWPFFEKTFEHFCYVLCLIISAKGVICTRHLSVCLSVSNLTYKYCSDILENFAKDIPLVKEVLTILRKMS